MFIWLLAILLILLTIWLWIQLELLKKSAQGIDGPPTKPVVGNIFDLGRNTEEMTKYVFNLMINYPSPVRICLGPFRLVIALKDPDEIETILTSKKVIAKAKSYDFIKMWLKEGLLTSHGERWHKHRKMLTPAFHFKILERFVDIFVAKGEILVNILNKHVNEITDIYDPIARCALDVITETAMGVNLDIQKNGNSEYLNNVRAITKLLTIRSTQPWVYNDFIYGLTRNGQETKRRLESISHFTNQVIKKRRLRFINMRIKDEFETKKKLAFLDLLFEIQREDPSFTDEDIKQETDTFMFAGHDTTASAISFSLFFLAKFPETQNLLVEEMNMIFGDSLRSATFNDLQEMNYLERVIKESLRIIPSVGVIGRYAEQDIALRENVIIPKGAEIMLMLTSLHHNNKYWPENYRFDPDRFLPDNFRQRHPFSYLPFSGGLRNCIGQKFAMLEMKLIISTIVRHFKLIHINHELKMVNEVVSKSKSGVKIRIEKRNVKQDN